MDTGDLSQPYEAVFGQLQKSGLGQYHWLSGRFQTTGAHLVASAYRQDLALIRHRLA